MPVVSFTGFLWLWQCRAPKSYAGPFYIRHMPHPIHTRANAVLILCLVLGHAAILMLPALWVASPAWAFVMLPLILASSLQWGLIHEGIHKNLLPDAAWNDRASRLLGILMGASFHVLRFGHLMHHKLNRDWHSENVQHRSPATTAYYYANLFFGLYLGEIITSLMFTLLPQRQFLRIARATFLNGYEEVAIAGERFFYQRGNVRFVRRDMALSLAVYAGAFWLYGAHWPWLLGFVAARAVIISFLDNVYHYATPADNSKAGKELVLPELLSLALLRSNFHETHHPNPEVPWHRLPTVHAQQNRAYDGAWLTHARMQLQGPVL